MRRGQPRGEHRKRRAKPRGRVRGTAGASGARDGPVGGELPKVGLGLLGNMCVIGWVVGESSQPIPPPSPSPLVLNETGPLRSAGKISAEEKARDRKTVFLRTKTSKSSKRRFFFWRGGPAVRTGQTAPPSGRGGPAPWPLSRSRSAPAMRS